MGGFQFSLKVWFLLRKKENCGKILEGLRRQSWDKPPPVPYYFAIYQMEIFGNHFMNKQIFSYCIYLMRIHILCPQKFKSLIVPQNMVSPWYNGEQYYALNWILVQYSIPERAILNLNINLTSRLQIPIKTYLTSKQLKLQA